ncbi:MAG: pentapeptide repeat-containing protein [Pseudomonadota bacterium]
MIDPAFAGAGMLGKLTSKFSTGRTMEKAEAPSANGKEPWWGQVTLAVGAVDESSKLTRGLFTYFLTLSAYVAIAVFGTTQETLLLNAGIELPIIGTQVPVNAFYILAPGLLVAFHLNLLIKLWALKKKAESQANDLAARFDGIEGEAVRAYRELLFPYDFTMIVAGPRGRPVMRGAMGLIIALTVFAGPLALLFVILQRFAPAGINPLSLFHGGLIAADAAALTIFRFGLRRSGMVRPLIGTTLQVGLIVLIGTLGLSLSLIRWSLWMEDHAEQNVDDPNLSKVIEWRAQGYRKNSKGELYRDSRPRNTRLSKWALPRLDSDGYFCLINPEVAPDLCPALRRGEIVDDYGTIIDNDDLASTQRRLSQAVNQLCSASGGWSETQLSLSRRQLRGAYLGGVVAPCVLFSGADLTAVSFNSGYLPQAVFSYANLNHGLFVTARAPRAYFRYSTVTNTIFWEADLTRANFQYANLNNADFRAANLTRALLDGANFTRADFEGAYLKGADFDGSSVVAAELQQSFLFGTRFRQSIVTGSTWPNGKNNEGMLVLVDRACFAPLTLGTDSRNDPVAKCADLNIEIERLDGLGISLENAKPGDVILAARDLPAEFEEYACIPSSGDQSIGPDGKLMSLRSCTHQDFRERIRQFVCGDLNRLGRTEIELPDTYLTEPNPVIITAETCADVGLGTDWEREWLEEKFPDFDWDEIPR